MNPERHPYLFNQSLMLLCLVTLSSFSLFVSAGRYSLPALIAYVLSSVLLFSSLLPKAPVRSAFRQSTWSIRALYFSVALTTLFQLLRPRLRYVESLELYMAVRFIALLTFFVVIIHYLSSKFSRNSKKKTSPLLLVVGLVVVMFLLVPFISPNPFIDVIVFYEESAQALLEGLNPYDITYTNIYHPSTLYYPAGEACYYPYPPITFIVGLAGSVTGDPRWLLIGAHLLASFLLFRTARAKQISSEESLLIALLFLYVPAGLFVAESGWIDPLIALAVAMFSYLHTKGRLRPSLIAAGCAIALKQTMIVFLPLLAAYWLRDRWKRLLWVLLVPAATYAGFAVWSWDGLFEDLVQFHMQSPFRPDGLTLSSLVFRLTGQALPFLASIPPILVGLGLGVFLLGRVSVSEKATDPPNAQRTALLWTTYALVFLVALVSSKHAFANYYYYYHFLLVLSLVWQRAADLSDTAS